MSERIICNDNGGELREEIVRCRDCINKTTVEDRCLFFAMQLKETRTAVYPRITGDGFCAWGKKK